MPKRQQKRTRTRKRPARKPAVTVQRSSGMHVEIYKFDTAPDQPALWGFRARARNHEIIASGEGYTRRASARRGALRAFPFAAITYV